MKEKQYVEPESYPRLVPSSFLPTCFAEWFDAALQLKFDGLFLMASIASGNRGGSLLKVFVFAISPLKHPLGRYSMRDTLPDYDGITFLIDKNIDKALQDSKKELISILSDNSISQPIVIFVPTQNASRYANDPELISEFELEDVIRKGNGRVSSHTHSLRPSSLDVRKLSCELNLWN